MPKIKTNKMASKKLRVTGSGRVKRKQANTSHNTSKHGPKRRRKLRGSKMVDTANTSHVKGLLRNATIK